MKVEGTSLTRKISELLSLNLWHLTEKHQDYMNVVGWWILGLTFEYGYWLIVVCAAHDLQTYHDLSWGPLSEQTANETEVTRNCNYLPAGYILVPGVLPCTALTFLLPLLPFWTDFRFLLMVIAVSASFSLVGAALSWTWTLIGIGLISVNMGVGISTLIVYLPCFKEPRLVSAWSSGIGASGLLASLAYLLLTEHGVPLSSVMFAHLVVPSLMAFGFWVLLSRPQDTRLPVLSKDREPEPTLKETTKVVVQVLVDLTLPYCLSFFFQNLITQGLFELIVFDQDVITLSSRVRLLNFVYLGSLFVFKSSGEWFQVDRLWPSAFLNGVTFAVITSEAVYGWFGRGAFGFCVLVLLVVWEGAIAGINYVNTLKKVNLTTPERFRRLCVSVTVIGEPLGAVLAGLCTMPLHNAICSLPSP